MATDHAFVPILLYHEVAVESSPSLARWSVHPEVFAGHLDLILESGRTPYTVSGYLDGLAAGVIEPERAVVLTFDDGYAGVGAAAPRLVERGIVATLYVTTGSLRGTTRRAHTHLPPGPMLAVSDLADLEAMGIEIGAHSHTHPQLDAVSPARAREEVIASKEILERALDHPIRTFAYPHGYSSPTVRRSVAAAGFDSACAVRNAFSPTGQDRFRISRLTVESDTETGTIKAWLAGAAAPLAGRRDRARTTAWRYWRRARVVRGCQDEGTRR